MEAVYTREFSLHAYEADWMGLARPVSLLNFLQESALEHAARLGVAVPDLREKDLTWVLSRYFVRFFSYPTAHHRLEVRTWPSMRETLFTWRDFEISGGDGRLFATATSSWALLDLQTKRPVRLDEVLPDYPLDSRRALEVPSHRIPELLEPEAEIPFRVRTTDLDMNQHVNNAVYVEWALESVPPEILFRCRPAEIEIAYRAEAFHGETILSRTAENPGESGRGFLHQVVGRENGREYARARTIWREFP